MEVFSVADGADFVDGLSAEDEEGTMLTERVLVVGIALVVAGVLVEGGVLLEERLFPDASVPVAISEAPVFVSATVSLKVKGNWARSEESDDSIAGSSQ